MRIFFTIFSAILAAAIVLLLSLYGWARLNQWERAKRLCYVQISSEVDAMNVRASQDKADMQALAEGAEDFHNVVQLAGRV
jgi:hypothetical protein